MRCQSLGCGQRTPPVVADNFSGHDRRRTDNQRTGTITDRADSWINVGRQHVCQPERALYKTPVTARLLDDPGEVRSGVPGCSAFPGDVGHDGCEDGPKLGQISAHVQAATGAQLCLAAEPVVCVGLG